MSFSAHLQHTDTGLAIVFAGPLTRLDMTADVAAHFASLLAVEARQRMVGVVRALEAVATEPTTHPLCCDCDGCLNGDQDG